MTEDLPPKTRPRLKPAKSLGPPKPAGLAPLPKQPKPPAAPKRPPAPERQAAQKLGLTAESKAAAFLLAKGYRILTRRFRTPVGEIDIVAGRRDTVVFVEVKARDTLDAAAEAVTPRQQSRIVDAARYWLAAHPEAAAAPLRFDVVLVAPGRMPKHLQGAFDAGA